MQFLLIWSKLHFLELCLCIDSEHIQTSLNWNTPFFIQLSGTVNKTLMFTPEEAISINKIIRGYVAGLRMGNVFLPSRYIQGDGAEWMRKKRMTDT